MFLINLSAFLLTVANARALIGENAISLGCALLAAALCTPALNTLLLGQLALIISAATSSALLLLQRKKDLRAGLLFAVAAVKPHLIGFLLIWVLLRCARVGRFRLALGFGGAIALLSAIALTVNPLIFFQWLHMEDPLQYASASLITPIRLLFARHEMPWMAHNIGIIIDLVVAAAVITHALFGRIGSRFWTVAPLLQFVSIILVPYMWIFDFPVLLLTEIYLVSHALAMHGTRRLVLLAVIVGTAIATFYFQTQNIVDYRIFWYPLPLFGCWLYVRLKGSLDDKFKREFL